MYHQLLNASRDALVNFQSSFAGLEKDLGLLGDARSLLDLAVASLQEEVRNSHGKPFWAYSTGW